jgi:hypothetical protein
MLGASFSSSFRGGATGSRECAPDGRLRVEPGIHFAPVMREMDFGFALARAPE